MGKISFEKAGDLKIAGGGGLIIFLLQKVVGPDDIDIGSSSLGEGNDS